MLWQDGGSERKGQRGEGVRNSEGEHFRGSSTPVSLDARWQWGDLLDTKSRSVLHVTHSQTME